MFKTISFDVLRKADRKVSFDNFIRQHDITETTVDGDLAVKTVMPFGQTDLVILTRNKKGKVSMRTVMSTYLDWWW